MTDEILDLSALAPERAKVRLRTEAKPDGTIYELAVPEEFGAAGIQRIGRLIVEVDELWESARRSTRRRRRGSRRCPPVRRRPGGRRAR